MSIIIEEAKKIHISGLVTLFKENYGLYHYNAFSDEKLLQELFYNNLIGWIGRENDKIIAFSGLYDIVQDDYHLIKLAHLLVDKNYRGYHIGSRLEEARNDYYSKIQHSLVVASCVDEPLQSIQLKLKHGFSCLGIKTNYRSSNLVGKNGVIFGKYNGILHREVHFEPPTLVTQNFIEQICENNNFEYKFDKLNAQMCDVKFEYEIDPLNSRIVAYISSTKKGILLSELIKLFNVYNMRYMSIRINTRIKGFEKIDNLLHSNGYTPVMYIPYYSKQVDLLEYQRLNAEDYITYKKFFEKYIRK